MTASDGRFRAVAIATALVLSVLAGTALAAPGAAGVAASAAPGGSGDGVLAVGAEDPAADVAARSVRGVRVMTAPHDPLAFATRASFLARFPTREAVMAHLATTDRVAVGDYLVVEVAAAGIYDQVDDRHDLLGVDAAGNATGLFLAIRETNPPDTRAAHRVDFVHRDHLLFVAPEHEAVYLVVDTETAGLQPDTVYEAVFEINATNELVGSEREVAKATFVVDDREATVDTPDGSGHLDLPADANATVAGETTLAPGTRLAVVLDGAANDAPVAMTRTANVTANRTFAATFDLSGVPAGANLTATVEQGGDSLAGETNATVVEPPAAEGEATAATATASPATTAEPTTTGEVATVAPEATATSEATVTTTREATTADDAAGDAGAAPDDAAGNVIESPGQPSFGVAVALLVVLGTVALLATRRG